MTASAGMAATNGWVAAVVAGPPQVGVLLARELAQHERLIGVFLAGRSPRTMAACREDLEGLRRFVGAATPAEAEARLLASRHGEANALALEHRACLRDQPSAHDPGRTLSAATIMSLMQGRRRVRRRYEDQPSKPGPRENATPRVPGHTSS